MDGITPRITPVSPINYNAQHVVFISALGVVAFAETALYYHKGCDVIAYCKDFYSAASFVEQMKATASPSQSHPKGQQPAHNPNESTSG